MSVDHVAKWFAHQGFPVGRNELVRTAFVYDDRDQARQELAKHFGVALSDVPDSFSGTVDQQTLFVVSRSVYKETYKRLYPDWPWVDENYRGLITHEVAHQAHSLIARSRLGSEDAMGPRWFFEGLAILCADNFDRANDPRMTWEDFIAAVAKDQKDGLSYVIYGRMIRSLASAISVKYLIEHAGDKGFPATLEKEYAKGPGVPKP